MDHGLVVDTVAFQRPLIGHVLAFEYEAHVVNGNGYFKDGLRDKGGRGSKGKLQLL